MSRDRGKGYDGKGFDSRNGQSGTPTAAAHDSVPGFASLTRSGEEVDAGSAALSYLSMRTDGWLRLVPDKDGKILWVKWKWTEGRWAGYYVLARVAAGDWPAGMTILFGKVTAVDAGKMVAVKDHPYE